MFPKAKLSACLALLAWGLMAGPSLTQAASVASQTIGPNSTVFYPAAYGVAYDINTVTDATLTTSGSTDSSSANDPIDQSDLDDPGVITIAFASAGTGASSNFQADDMSPVVFAYPASDSLLETDTFDPALFVACAMALLSARRRRWVRSGSKSRVRSRSHTSERIHP